jgi:hypothetical protein
VIWGGIEDSPYSDEGFSSSHSAAVGADRRMPSGIIIADATSSEDSHAKLERAEASECSNGDKLQVLSRTVEGGSSSSSIQNIPVDENGNKMSIGSILHDKECTPCAFLSRKKGCVSGVLCSFCHFSHDDSKSKQRNRPRPCKGQRLRYRRQFSRFKEAVEDAPEEFDLNELELPPSIAGNEHLKSKFFSRLKAEQERLLQDRSPASGAMDGQMSPPGAHDVDHGEHSMGKSR